MSQETPSPPQGVPGVPREPGIVGVSLPRAGRQVAEGTQHTTSRPRTGGAGAGGWGGRSACSGHPSTQPHGVQGGLTPTTRHPGDPSQTTPPPSPE